MWRRCYTDNDKKVTFFNKESKKWNRRTFTPARGEFRRLSRKETKRKRIQSVEFLEEDETWRKNDNI